MSKKHKTLILLPGVSFSTESVGGSNVNGEDEETNSSISSSTTVSELPSSVVQEILLRLPHKSIIQCQCVCKSWYNLISDPHFTRAYFANPPFTTVVLYQRILVNKKLQGVSFRFLEIDDSNGDVTFAPFHPRALNFPVNGTDLEVVGSCNGLLCITQTHLYTCNVAVYVINPLLGEYHKLPPVEFRKITAGPAKPTVAYGFGCSRYSNRYKVLRVLRDFNAGKVHSEIITVGVDEKWRSVVDASLTMVLIHNGVAMNGAVHLLGDVDRYVLVDVDQYVLSYYYGYILAFDMEEERGRHIRLPPIWNDDKRNFQLAVWDDKLCFLENDYTGTQVDIWVMKEYGVVESWSKETILKSWVPIELRPYPLHPITTLRNKALLMTRKGFEYTRLLQLTSYNPTVKMCTKHEVPGVAGTEDVCSYWFAYVPNAIPLMDNLLGGGRWYSVNR